MPKLRVWTLSIALLALATVVFSAEKNNLSNQIQSKSFLFDGKLDRTTPEIYLKPGSIVDSQNVIRPAPGVGAGWKVRSGSTKHNTTAIAQSEVKGVWQYTNPNLRTRTFLAQCNDQIVEATNDIPSTTGGSFGTGIYDLTSGASPAFCDHINDDFVGAAAGTTPFAYAGGLDYPKAFLIFHEYESSITNYVVGTYKVNNSRKDDNVLLVQHGGDQKTGGCSEWVYFGYQRRLSAVNLDLVTGATNSVTSGITIQKYQDGEWVSASNRVDGTTKSGGDATLHESGTISWDYDINDDPYILPGTADHLFWYRSSVTADVTDGILAYRVRVSDACEAITSLWSGDWEVLQGCFLSTTTGYQEYTAKVTDGSQIHYVDLGGLTTSNALYVGFANPVFSIYLHLNPDYVNLSTDVFLKTISYCSGISNDFVPISGTTIDGTVSGDKALHHSGVIQWEGGSIVEQPRFLAGNPFPLYYYKLEWSEDLPSGIRAWEIASGQKPGMIPPMPHYDGIIEHGGRAWAWPGHYYKHGLDFAENDKPWVWTGPYAGTIGNILGPGRPNSAARLHSFLIVSTVDPLSLWVVEGKVPGRFDEHRISDKQGAIAPHSMITINDAVKLFNQNLNVNAVALMSPDGFYMTDGLRAVNFSQPIADFFDSGSTPYIEPAYMHTVHAWADYKEKSLHFAAPVNFTNSDDTQTTKNYEFVYSYPNDEWWGYHKRNSPLSCGISVVGSDNQRMVYGGDYDGYVWRSGTSNSDDGNAIDHWVKSSQIPLAGLNKQFRTLGLRARYKARTAGNIDPSVFPDDKIVGISPSSGTTNMSMENDGYRMTSGKVLYNEVGESCGYKFRSGVSDVEEMEIHGFTVDYQREIPTGGP